MQKKIFNNSYLTKSSGLDHTIPHFMILEMIPDKRFFLVQYPINVKDVTSIDFFLLKYRVQASDTFFKILLVPYTLKHDILHLTSLKQIF